MRHPTTRFSCWNTNIERKPDRKAPALFFALAIVFFLSAPPEAGGQSTNPGVTTVTTSNGQQLTFVSLDTMQIGWLNCTPAADICYTQELKSDNQFHLIRVFRNGPTRMPGYTPMP